MEMQQFVSLENARTQVDAIVDAAYKKFLERAGADNELPGSGTGSLSALGKPQIRWRKFGFSVAGITRCESNIIELNINYLYSADHAKFLKSTPLHELAHSIAFQLCRDATHGKVWKHIDRLLGDEPQPYHEYARPLNAPKKSVYVYECGGCKTVFKLSERQHREIGTYCCRKCKTLLLAAKFIEKTYI